MKALQSRARKNLRFALRVAWLLFRGFALISILLLALVAAAVFVLPQLVSGERVRGMLVAQLEETLRRPVQIQKVIVTPQGIKLHGIRISGKADPKEYLLDGDFALVTIKLRPLLQRRLELRHVRFVEPRLLLSRDAQGRWNVADLFESTAAARPAAAGRFALPISLAAEDTEIEGGVLRIDDHLRNTSHIVKRFNLAVHKFDADRPFTYALSFDNLNRFGDKEVHASLALQGSVSLASFNWPEAYLRAERLQLRIDGRVIRGSGGVTGFPLGVIDADILVPALGPSDWSLYFAKSPDLTLPPSRWRLKMQFLGPRQLRIDHIQASAPPLMVSGSGVIDMAAGEPRLVANVALADFPLSAAAAFDGVLGRYALGGFAQGQASVSGWLDRLVVHRAQVRLRNLEAAMAHWRVGHGDVDLSASDDFSKVSVGVAHGGIYAFSNSFTDIGATLKLTGQDLSLERLAVRWGDSRLKLKARVLNISKPKEVSISGNLDRLRWESAQALVNGVVASVSTKTFAAEESEDAPKKPWVRTFKYVIPKKFPDTVGHIHIGEVAHKNFSFQNTDLLWDIRGVTPSLKRVSGDARVSFGPGRIEDIQAVQSSHKFLRIIFLPYIYMHKMNSLSVLSAATAYPKTLDFNRIEGQYGLDQGVASIRFSYVDGPQVVAFADGMADFGKEQVDMNILTRLTSYRAPLPEWWVDELGRPAIGFRVKGDLNSPDLEPRLHKMASDEIEKALEAARGRAKARFEAIEKLQTLQTQ